MGYSCRDKYRLTPLDPSRLESTIEDLSRPMDMRMDAFWKSFKIRNLSAPSHQPREPVHDST